MIGVLIHWNPLLKQSKINNNIWKSKYCPICEENSYSYIFRVNTKLKVYKCYNCGSSGKEVYNFTLQLKHGNNHNILKLYYSKCFNKNEIKEILDNNVDKNEKIEVVNKFPF